MDNALRTSVEYAHALEPSRPAPKSQRDILVIDDDVSTRQRYARLLAKRGFDLMMTDTAEIALALLSRTRVRAVVVDLNLSGMGGLELLRRVRSLDPDVPVVLTTSGPDMNTALRALELGASRYIHKSDDEARLIEEITTLLERVRGAKEPERRAPPKTYPRASRLRDVAEASFSAALDALWMAYQPIVSASTRTVFGYEALVRTREASVPNPGVLFALAEALGRVTELGARIRAEVSRASSTLPDGATLFVNVHGRDLLDPDLFDPRAPLSRIASRVVLEVTERTTLDDVTDLSSRIAALRALGYRIAIDDLGAGYASLISFVNLDLQIAKIDMSLVHNIDTHLPKQRVIRTLVDMCKNMNLLVVAEGIETQSELRTLRALGCDLLQGFYFARPAATFVKVPWNDPV